MLDKMDSLDRNEGKQFLNGKNVVHDIGGVMGNMLNSHVVKTVTVGALASLLSACTEPNWPDFGLTGVKKDTVPHGITIILPDSAENTYTIDIVIDTSKTSE